MPLAYDPARAAAHVASAHPGFAALVARVGPVAIVPREEPPYASLRRAIVSQQLSTAAARTIHGRLLDRLGASPGTGSPAPDADAPATLLALDDDTLRGVGLSRAKAAALRDLAARTLDGTVPDLATAHILDDDALVARLTAVRGVGRWTVEMLLIFGLGRADVWPIDDLGVRKGYARLAGLDTAPAARALGPLGDAFRPYRSAAAWYCWRALDTG